MELKLLLICSSNCGLIRKKGRKGRKILKRERMRRREGERGRKGNSALTPCKRQPLFDYF